MQMIATRIEGEVIDVLDREAFARQISRSALIAEILREWAMGTESVGPIE